MPVDGRREVRRGEADRWEESDVTARDESDEIGC